MTEAEHAPKRNPAQRFQRGFEARFERLRHGYRGVLEKAMARRKAFLIGFVAVVGLSFLLVPFLGSNFFPSVDSGQVLIHARVPVGTRIEETATRFAKSSKRSAAPSRAARSTTMVDNIGLPSSINITYNNTGVIGRPGRRLPDRPEGEGHRRPRNTCASCARTAARIPGHHLLVPAGRHRQPDPELRFAGADRRAGARPRHRRQLRVCAKAAEARARDSRRGRRPHPAVATARRCSTSTSTAPRPSCSA
jgi:multidrug efflux pump subunit AcrB